MPRTYLAKFQQKKKVVKNLLVSTSDMKKSWRKITPKAGTKINAVHGMCTPYEKK